MSYLLLNPIQSCFIISNQLLFLSDNYDDDSDYVNKKCCLCTLEFCAQFPVSFPPIFQVNQVQSGHRSGRSVKKYLIG